ncbi:MAG TPA: ABC transporter ATP-binding protein [Candidatus Evtepia faecigallinarum]|nr:ABC transporter ATP-binding protein [Candidatus Evtepia faecigallinarum]
MDSIWAKDLCKSWGDFALERVSFQVPQGRIVGLMGENGAGKSTTLRLLAGALAPDSGEIRLLGGSPQDPAVRAQVGAVFDHCPFPGSFSANTVGRMLAGIYPTWDAAYFRSCLGRFQVPPEKPIAALSKGTRQKLAIACALAHRPKILLLDEATAGLDPVVRDDLLDLFLEYIQDEAHAILFSSHITGDMEKVADYVIFLHQGKVIFQAQKDELLEQYGIARCGREAFARLDKSDYLLVRQTNAATECLVADKEVFHKKYPSILLDRTSLEEIMLFYTKGDGPWKA